MKKKLLPCSVQVNFSAFFATLVLLIEYKYLRPAGKSARPCEVERSFAGVLVYTPSLPLHGTLQKSISTDILGDANTPYFMSKTAIERTIL